MNSEKKLVSRELDEAQIKEEIEGGDLSHWITILKQRYVNKGELIVSVQVDGL